jgi:hypothetical protein
VTKQKSTPPSYGPMFAKEKDSALIEAALQRILDDASRDPKKLEDLRKALRAPAKLGRSLGEALRSAVAKTVPSIFKGLKAHGPAMLRKRRSVFAGFERRLYRSWKRPLDLLEMLTVVCIETGEGLSAEWPWKESEEHNLVFDVVRRLQARACQVASEVLMLLKTGYAPAAHARWRTLHETAVTAFFIAKHGKDAAERYLAHEYIEAHKAAQQYQRHCQKLGYSRYSRKELAAFRKHHNAALKHYGGDFKGDYGWAAVTLGRKRVTFLDIEKAVRLDHLRPFYRMASYPVHASVKSIRFSLALERGQKMLLTGPSNLGLTGPGHSTAISLGQITLTMLNLRPTSDTISVARVLLLFTDEIGQAFMEAQKALHKKGKK